MSYLTLGTLEQNTDIEATLGYLVEQVQRRGDAAVESVSLIYRSAARRWVNNIANEVTATRDHLVADKAGQPFFARHPQTAQRILANLTKSLQQNFAELEEASSGPLTRAITAQNLMPTIIEVTGLVGQKLGALAAAGGGGFAKEIAQEGKTNPAFAIALALGSAVAVAYVWRSFR